MEPLLYDLTPSSLPYKHLIGEVLLKDITSKLKSKSKLLYSGTNEIRRSKHVPNNQNEW